jgi:flavin reductase (DIM6/NTAB) family NADH-FMN oxidoreductase RutF
MPRIVIPLARAYHLVNHGACPLLTTGDGARRDIAPINWTMPVCDDPFLVATAVEDGIYTDELIKATGEFAVNVVSADLAPVVLGLGKVSGRQIDKFAAFDLKAVPCKTIKPPRLAGARAHVECQVVDRHSYSGVVLYIAKVLHAEVEADCWDGKYLILEKVKTIHHVGGGLFSVTDGAIRCTAVEPKSKA